jgi:hypothetical protein
MLAKLMGNTPAVAIIGPGHCGKDTAADIISRLTGFRFLGSTSWHVKEFVAHRMGINAMTAWETRRTRRKDWRRHVDSYREGDPARIVREMVSDGAAIITGIRTHPELSESLDDGLIGPVIWISRDNSPDPTNELTTRDADHTVFNTGTIEDLKDKLRVLLADIGLYGKKANR